VTDDTNRAESPSTSSRPEGLEPGGSSAPGRYGYGVELVPNGEDGGARFRADLAAVAELLGPLAQEIEPIGSRLVPGIEAKPITDLIVQILPEDLPRAEARLAGAGLQEIKLDHPARTMFRRCRPGTTTPDLHVHLATPGAWHSSRERAFYRLLQSRPTVAAAYSAVKRLALELSDGDPKRYGDLKSQFIEWALEVTDECGDA
jgi:GrpB-like predicted nucleotidyltransferase (UPF0157 family)